MPKKLKILVNGLTLDDANLVPLSKKMSFWKMEGALPVVVGSNQLIKKIDKKFQKDSIGLGFMSKLGGGFTYLGESLRRNVYIIKHLDHLPAGDVVYTISSVLDMVILPFVVKKLGRTKKWVTVFDNTVPLVANGKIIAGNIVIRLLAWVFFKLSLFFIKSADFIFVVKPELKEYLTDRRFDPSKIVITGNGVEADLILKAKSRQKYQCDALFLGRINEAKGIYDLLAVANLVILTNPDFKLSIVGNGDSKTIASFKSKIASMGLKNNVKLLGFKTGQEKYDIIKSCKVFLFLSHTESVPVAPMEAVCSGKPVIVYDLDAYNMYKNKEVLVCKQGDILSAASKLKELLKKPILSNTAGVKLLNKYSWDSIAKKEYKYIASQ